MFFFTKLKPIDVYLYTTREEVFLFSKPKMANNFIPNWVKNLPKPQFDENKDVPLFKKTNIKTCPAFINLYKTGFVVPLWSDLNVEIEPDAYRYQFIDKQSNAESHPEDQLTNSPFDKKYVNLKLINPWYIHTKEHTEFLFNPPLWNGFGYDDIVLPTGIYSPHKIVLGLNINLFFKVYKEKKIYELYLGDPLVHVIPLTNRKIKLHYILSEKKEIEKLLRRNPFYLMDTNRFSRMRKMLT